MEAEEARRLLDNGYRVVLFVDGLGQYCALAVPNGQSLSAAARAWRDYEPADDITPAESVYDGPNRFCGSGPTVSAALHAAETVFLKRLPDPH